MSGKMLLVYDALVLQVQGLRLSTRSDGSLRCQRKGNSTQVKNQDCLLEGQENSAP